MPRYSNVQRQRPAARSASSRTGYLKTTRKKWTMSLPRCGHPMWCCWYHTSDMFWEQLDREVKEIRKTVPVICLGTDPLTWGLSTVDTSIVATCQTYLTNNGDENFRNLLRYIGKVVFSQDVPVEPPLAVPWDGLYHPDAPEVFLNAGDYRAWYAPRACEGPWVAVLFSRVSWASSNCAIEDALIRALEAAGLNVIPVFHVLDPRRHARRKRHGPRGGRISRPRGPPRGRRHRQAHPDS